jgi:F-type H+-transporting ATPase subunit gamma
MASARDIRRRIKGVKATGKITRAMEMISAVKMRKAVASVLAIQTFHPKAIETEKSATSQNNTADSINIRYPCQIKYKNRLF